jgi:release factor glutamine methyltransferase
VRQTRLGILPATARAAAVRRLAAVLAAKDIEEAALDARLLVCAAAEITHADLVRDPDLELGEVMARRLETFAARRIAREPVSRILGSRGFWDLDLLVTPAVLDPRPETETLIEAALEALAERREAALRIVDLGTGSGALLCALLGEFPAATGIGIDLSAAACDVARRNLVRCGFAGRGEIQHGDWTAAKGRRFDLAIANPPYIASETIRTLAPEVRDHDPRLALDGGVDGLEAYRAIAGLLPEILVAEGLAILETGAGQGEAVRDLVRQAGLTAAAPRRDLAGSTRAVVAFAPPPATGTA